MTPTQIEQQARERYNAVGETFWSQSEIFGLIWNACQELAVKTHCIERVYTTTTVASQQEYERPTNAISIKRITYNGSPVDPISFDEADQITLYNSAQVTTGSPLGYTEWDETIALHPTPSEAQTLKIYCYNEPQEITVTSTLEVPTMAHHRLVNYVLSEMYAKDKDFSSAAHYKNLWLADVQEVDRFMKRKKRGNRLAQVKDESAMPAQFVG